MDFMGRYHGSKGIPESIVEDGVLGNLAPPGDLEESASHHLPRHRYLGHPSREEGRGAKHSPPGQSGENHRKFEFHEHL